MLHNRVHDIKADTAGNLVILTYNGISFFDGESFTSFSKPFNNVLYDFAVDRDNRVWICEKQITKKLYLFNDGFYKTIYEAKNGISFQFDRANNVGYFAIKDSLFQVFGDSLKFLSVGSYGIFPKIGDLNDQHIFIDFKENGDWDFFYPNHFPQTIC